VPVLGTIYRTGELRQQPDVTGFHPAVHHGHHHGLDGALLVLTALLLSRLLPAVRARGLRGLLGGYLALMLCYGAGNIASDFWLEQVVKRGWTLWEIPDVTTPKASVTWGPDRARGGGALAGVRPASSAPGQARASTTFRARSGGLTPGHGLGDDCGRLLGWRVGCVVARTRSASDETDTAGGLTPGHVRRRRSWRCGQAARSTTATPWPE
jgi:hypothetical protein